MEEEEETTSLSMSSTVTLTQQNVSRPSTTSLVVTGSTKVIPKCHIVTQQASGDSMESESESMSQKVAPKYSLLATPHSSSSQEDYEPQNKGQFLSVGHRIDTTRSMESLKTATSTKSYFSSSEKDMNKLFSKPTETKSLECMDREATLKRHAISGEGAFLLGK